MRNAFLVALREYVENAKTKGFWIGIFMLPLVLFLSFQIPIFLEKKGAPVRHFVLVDHSGEFETLVEQELEQEYNRRLLSDLLDYVRQNTGGLPEFARPFASLRPEAAARFVELGGQAYFLGELAPRLPANPPPFSAPRKLFRRIPTSS